MNKNNSNSCRYMLIVIACISDHYCYYEKNVGESFYPGGSHLFLRWK